MVSGPQREKAELGSDPQAGCEPTSEDPSSQPLPSRPSPGGEWVPCGWADPEQCTINIYLRFF